MEKYVQVLLKAKRGWMGEMDNTVTQWIVVLTKCMEGAQEVTGSIPISTPQKLPF